MKNNEIKIIMDKDIDKPWIYDGDPVEFVHNCLVNCLLKAPHQKEKGKLDDWDFMVRNDVAEYARICGISHESIARELVKIGKEFLAQTSQK